MTKFISIIRSNSFLKNVSILASGTIISQIVVILSSIILSRIYSVEDFGFLSLFTSIITIAAIVSTGRYELAIGIPNDDNEALAICKLINVIGIFISLIYLLITFIFNQLLKVCVLNELFLKSWIYLGPLYVFLVANLSAMLYWLQRKKLYKKITFVNALQVILTSLFSLFFGFFNIHLGMIYSLILAIFFVCIYILYTELEFWNSFWNFKDFSKPIKKYINFPKYALLSDLSSSISQQFIPILFSVFYTTTIVGYFALANRMLRLPNIVITNAIANIFRNEAIDEIRKKGNCDFLYKSTFKKLLILSIPIYVILFITSPYIFELVFGNDWNEAGIYARIISTFLFFEFIATPLNTIYYIRDYQKKLMTLQFLNTFFGGLSISLGAFLFEDSKMSLILFSLNAIFFNLLFIAGSFKISKIISDVE